MMISPILIAVAIINVILGILILFRSPKDKVNIFYILLTSSIAVWTMSLYFFRTLTNPDSIIFTGKIVYIAAAFIALLFLYFTIFFPQKKTFFKKTANSIILLIFLAILILIISSPKFIKGFTIIENNNALLFGNLYFLYVLFIISYFGLGFINLLFTYKKSSGTEKLQIRYVFLGTSISSFLAVITNLFLVWFGDFRFNWLGPLFTVIMVVFIAYAIVKYNLMNVRAIATEFLIFALWIIFLVRLLMAGDLQQRFVEGGFFVAISIFGFWIIKNVLMEVKRREEIERISKELEDANKRLRELDRIKTEFLSFTTHQIKAPLTTIKGFAKTLTFPRRFGYMYLIYD